MRKIQAALVVAASIAGGACGRSMLYQRTRLDPATVERLAKADGWDHAILSVGEVDLQGLVRRPAGESAPWVLFFGGNATALDGSMGILAGIRGDADMGLAVFAYRGYDGSEGYPSQRWLTFDGAAAARHLGEFGAAPGKLVIVGQSLGSGVATQVTARLQEGKHAPAALVLVSPFTSVPDVAHDHVGCAPVCLFPDPWRTRYAAPGIRVPVLVLHGSTDQVIPERQGREVAAAFPDARFVPVPGRDHNDLWSPETFAEVRSFVLQWTR